MKLSHPRVGRAEDGSKLDTPYLPAQSQLVGSNGCGHPQSPVEKPLGFDVLQDCEHKQGQGQ